MSRSNTAPRAPIADERDDELAHAVHAGLTARHKALPAWLFYDARGSELFERITRLPEYYLTRAEAEIFASRGAELIAAATAARGADTALVELGAGTFTKTQILLTAACALHGSARFVPVDVSPAALELGRARLAAQDPRVRVEPWVLTHQEAFARLRSLRGAKTVLFIGSSLGNYEGRAAVDWMAGLRAGLGRGDLLVLGTDFVKPPAEVLPAYDDASGVTAAFNKNVLARINRELGGQFCEQRFRHVALWNPERSCVEMHLESDRDQVVAIEALDLRVRFRAGERIHTESSVKYDLPMIDALCGRTGFERERTFTDGGRRFGVHLLRAS